MSPTPIVEPKNVEFDPRVVIRDAGDWSAPVYIGSTATSYLIFQGPLATTTPEFDAARAGFELRQVRLAEQRRFIDSFVQRAREIEPQVSIWAKYDPELVVSVVAEEPCDLDRELALHAVFIALARELDDPGTGDLVIRSADELQRDDLDVGDRVA